MSHRPKIPEALWTALSAKAAAAGIPTSRFLLRLLDDGLEGERSAFRDADRQASLQLRKQLMGDCVRWELAIEDLKKRVGALATSGSLAQAAAYDELLLILAAIADKLAVERTWTADQQW